MPHGADLLADIAAQPLGEGRYAVELPASWSFRLPSGGVLMSAALGALQKEIDDPELSPLSATAVFLEPLEAGPLVAECEVLRRGRSVTQGRARLAQNGAAAGLEVTGVFARDRSGPGVLAAEPPPAPPVEDAVEVGPGDRRPPLPFFENFDIRLAIGAPFWREDALPGESAEVARWFRYRRPPVAASGELDWLAIPPVADTMPSALHHKLGAAERFYAPSLDLTVHFLEPTAPGWLLARSYVRWAARGYATGEAEIWSESGRLVAYAAQTMLIVPVGRAAEK